MHTGRIGAAEAQHAAAGSTEITVLLHGRLIVVGAAIRAADTIDRVQGEHEQYRSCQQPPHEHDDCPFRGRGTYQRQLGLGAARANSLTAFLRSSILEGWRGSPTVSRFSRSRSAWSPGTRRCAPGGWQPLRRAWPAALTKANARCTRAIRSTPHCIGSLRRHRPTAAAQPLKARIPTSPVPRL